MRNRWIGLLALGSLALAGACDEEDDTILGTYQLSVFESRDTCDGTNNSFGIALRVESESQGQVVLFFGEEWQVTGTFDNEGLLQAQGTVEDLGDGRTTVLQVQIDFFRGGLNGNGRVVYAGTFPGVEGACQQDIVFDGDRADALSPVLLTAPDAR